MREHLQKHRGEGPSQVNAVSPGAILLHPNVLPCARPSRRIPTATRRSRTPWIHPNLPAQLVGCPFLRTPHAAPSPATPTRKPEEKPWCCCHRRAVPAPSGHMREGTAPAANGKVQGRGEPQGEAHKGLIVRQVPLGCARTGPAVQQQNAAQKYDKTPFSQAAVKL